MSELFLKVVNMSIAASWLVLAVLFLRLILKKAPKWVSVLLWGLVAVRLICPFSIESVLSLIPSAETISPEIMMDWTPEVSTGIHSMDAVVNPIITESFAPKPYASANPLQILIPVCGNLWVLGILIMLLYTAVSYLLLRHKVATAVLLRDNIYQSECVDSPFVLGIIKPRIYLPFQMDGKHLEYVIAHEQSHIRRKDHLWKPLGFLLLALHWFNPLIWLGYTFLCRDIELACDEKVIKEMDSETKADYTQALVACSINRRSIAACPLAFGEVGVKARVKSVLNYKKPAFWIITVAVVVCIAVAVCFLTDPQKQTDSNTADKTLPDSGQVETIVGNLKTYLKNPDGTWQVNGHTYQYRLEIAGKLSESSRESIFVVLSNTEAVTFARVRDAASSNNLKLAEEDAIVVAWLHPVANDLRDFEKPTGESLTLDYVIKLSEKESEICWDDFQNFTGHEIGSGFRIMRYNIDGHLYVLVGENGISDNPYAMLCCTHNYHYGVDIQSDDLKRFIELCSPGSASLLESAETFNSKEISKYATAEGFVTPESIRSGIPCRIHLSKQKNDAAALFGSTTYDLCIEVDTGTKVLKKELENGMLPIAEGSLFLGDIDGDKIQEIFVHGDTGGVGGFGAAPQLEHTPDCHRF